MTKTELIAKAHADTGVSKADVERVLDAAFLNLKNDLASGNKTTIRGFGTFSTKARAARIGRNPRTGAEVHVPAHNVVAFKPAKDLKEAVK